MQRLFAFQCPPLGKVRVEHLFLDAKEEHCTFLPGIQRGVI